MTLVRGLEPDQERVEVGDPSPEVDLAVDVEPAQPFRRRRGWSWATYSMAANLTGWSCAMARAAVSPDEDLDRGQRSAAMANGIAEAQPVVAVPAAAQQPDRVDRRATTNPVTMYAARIMCGVS